jgi:hypothetical protein
MGSKLMIGDFRFKLRSYSYRIVAISRHVYGKTGQDLEDCRGDADRVTKLVQRLANGRPCTWRTGEVESPVT